MAQQIQLRRGTAAEWTLANPVLATGEAGVEIDTFKVKYGNGSLAWNSLPYSAGGTGIGTVTSVAATGTQGVSISGSPITSSGTLSIGLGAITPTSVSSSGAITGSNLSGTNTGDQTITLTGDVTGTGTASFATTLANSGVTANTYGSSTQVPVFTVDAKGRITSVTNTTITSSSGTVTSVAATGNNGISISGSPITSTGTLVLGLGAITPTSVTASGNISATGSLSGSNFSGSSSGTNTGDQTITLTGDVTGTGTGSFAATLSNSGVTANTYGSSTQVPVFTVDAKGRITSVTNTTITSSSGTVTSVGVSSTGTHSAALTVGSTPITTSGTITLTLNQFSSTTSGVVPQSGGGTANFLRADGTWVAPSGSGTVTSVAATGNNGISISGSPITSTGTLVLGLGAITPTSVTASGSVTGSNLSGTNTGDQTITLTGDVTGTGTGSFAATLSNSGVTANTYGSSSLVPVITIDAKGRITSATTASIPATNLSSTINATTVTINSSTGTGVTVPSATQSVAGVLTASDKTRLDNSASLSPTVITETTTARTLSSGDNGAIIRFTNASPITVTVPTAFSGLNCVLSWQTGAGDITLVPSSTLLNGAASSIVLSATAGMASITPTGTANSFDVQGSIGNLVSTDITDSTVAGRALLTAVGTAAQRTLLSLVPGTNVQAYNATLQSVSSLSTSADQMLYFTGSSVAATNTLTPLARTLLDDTTAADMRNTIGAMPLQQSVITDATTARTLSSTDNGQVIRFTSNSPITITVPTAFSGFACRILRAGSGSITFSASGTTIANNAVINVNGGWATLLPTGTANEFNLIGYFAAAGGSGTVTSVDVSGGTTGLTTTGGPVTTSGTVTLTGTLAVTNGGTGATSAGAARTSLSAADRAQTTGISCLLEIPTAKTYTLVLRSPFAWTATEIYAISSAGTCTVQAAINGTPMTGGSVNVSTTIGSSTITANNVVAINNTITLVVTSVVSAADVTIGINGTRTLT